MSYILRDAQKTIKAFLTSQKVLLILGARQVGKTTLMKKVLEGISYTFLNLDIEVDYARLNVAKSLSPREAWKSFGSPEILVIDEAQRAPDLGRLVKGWYDASLPAKIILLGSSSVGLLDGVAAALTGRNQKLFLPPLIFSEIVSSQSWYAVEYSKKILIKSFANQLSALLMQSILYGSYPEIVLSDKTKEEGLTNLTSDYILRDILNLGLIKSPDTIRRLLLLLAYQIGSEVSISELSRTLQIARPTITHYLDLLERNFIIFRLPAFSTNRRKEIGRNTKIFFWDTGIRNALINEFSHSEFRSDIGMLWENWVIAEFAKRNLLEGNKKTLYFWRTTTGSEVDLIIKRGPTVEAFEIKWKKQSRAHRAFTRQYKKSVTVITSTTCFEYILR
ncbi:ATP-binding protein [Candidatus Uhrbacteria bacterium]|nr:ATP-binding protein [Candidatus Uhrbacteria bacterium]